MSRADLEIAEALQERDDRISELEANLDAVEKCQRYTIGVFYLLDNPDGEWMRTKDVLKALGEAT